MTPVPTKLSILVAHSGGQPWASSLAGSLAGWPVELHWSLCVDEALGVAQHRALHVGIVDDAVPTDGGLGLVRRMWRQGHVVPCVLVATAPTQRLLQDALTLNVFAVVQAQGYEETLIPAITRLIRDRYNLTVPDIGANN